MKKIYFIIFLFFIVFTSFAQESEFDIQKNIYNKSKLYNDPTVSINALYKMISLQPDNLNLLDTLLREYIGVSRWPSAYMVSREILSNNPNHDSKIGNKNPAPLYLRDPRRNNIIAK